MLPLIGCLPLQLLLLCLELGLLGSYQGESFGTLLILLLLTFSFETLLLKSLLLSPFGRFLVLSLLLQLLFFLNLSYPLLFESLSLLTSILSLLPL